MSRKHDSFMKLYNEDNLEVVIPIIQRDYAQGRDNDKSKKVRNRLIDDWISVLNGEAIPMDFNFIYGAKVGNQFIPIDGQQRLTALYLLHWYLAFASGNEDKIKNWKFDYKTRNSASEFFNFLKSIEDSEDTEDSKEGNSKELFDILRNSNKKSEDIRDAEWFKLKWQNDPTIASCIEFLCVLSDKLNESTDKLESYWNKLTDAQNPAVYFTLLAGDESNNVEANRIIENKAAKAYMRMNARGKRLTGFEILKAMIDEIEMDCFENGTLSYCDAGDIDSTVSYSYDKDYINAIYKSIDGNSSLAVKTEKINEESLKWYKIIYYVYCLLYQKENPGDLFEESSPIYDDTIYKISQKRQIDNDIKEYMRMLKAVQETLYKSISITENQSECLLDGIDGFSLKDYKDDKVRKRSVSFVTYVTEFWQKGDADDYKRILNGWKQFEDALKDLKYENWKIIDDGGLADIIKKMAQGIKDNSGDVNKYFINNDFNSNNPFGTTVVLNDINCRILERKIKSKLIEDGIINDTHSYILEHAKDDVGRLGYLYYVCGLMDDISIGDWSGKAVWTDNQIIEYARILSSKDDLSTLYNTRDFKAAYAYASQYDKSKNDLKDEKTINSCDNKHILDKDEFKWNDDEFKKPLPFDDKKEKLGFLQTALEQLYGYKKAASINYDDLISAYADHLEEEFANRAGYEKCWLRIAVKFKEGGKDILEKELKYDGETETVKFNDDVPVILKAYLFENDYWTKRFKGSLANLNNEGGQKVFYNELTGKDKNMKINEFSFCDTESIPCKFASGSCYEYSDREQSDKYDLDLTDKNSKNMILIYHLHFDFSNDGQNLENGFIGFNKDNGQYTISLYKLGDRKNGRIELNKYEAVIDAATIKDAESSIIDWQELFSTIVDLPNSRGNNDKNKWDRWLEIYNNNYQETFKVCNKSNFCDKDKYHFNFSNKKPKREWTQTLPLPPLNWSQPILIEEV